MKLLASSYGQEKILVLVLWEIIGDEKEKGYLLKYDEIELKETKLQAAFDHLAFVVLDDRDDLEEYFSRADNDSQMGRGDWDDTAKNKNLP